MSKRRFEWETVEEDKREGMHKLAEVLLGVEVTLKSVGSWNEVHAAPDT